MDEDAGTVQCQAKMFMRPEAVSRHHAGQDVPMLPGHAAGIACGVDKIAPRPGRNDERLAPLYIHREG